jgi:hypothetical protein
MQTPLALHLHRLLYIKASATASPPYTPPSNTSPILRQVPRQLPLNRIQVAKAVDTEDKPRHQNSLISNVTAGTNMV